MDCRRTYWPTVEWRTSHPEEQGLDASLLALADEYAQTSVPAMHALLIVRHGFIVQERYYQGFGPSSYHSVNSVTKSIVSALVGIALRDGYLVSTRQPLVSLLPESLLQTIDARRRSDSRLADVTLEDLLRMTAGFGLTHHPRRRLSGNDRRADSTCAPAGGRPRDDLSLRRTECASRLGGSHPCHRDEYRGICQQRALQTAWHMGELGGRCVRQAYVSSIR